MADPVPPPAPDPAPPGPVSPASKLLFGAAVAGAVFYFTRDPKKKFSLKGLFSELMFGEGDDDEDDEVSEEEWERARETSTTHKLLRQGRAREDRRAQSQRHEDERQARLTAEAQALTSGLSVREQRAMVEQMAKRGRGGLPGNARPLGPNVMRKKQGATTEPVHITRTFVRDVLKPVGGSRPPPVKIFVDPDRWRSDQGYRERLKEDVKARAIASDVEMQVVIAPEFRQTTGSRASASAGAPTRLWTYDPFRRRAAADSPAIARERARQGALIAKVQARGETDAEDVEADPVTGGKLGRIARLGRLGGELGDPVSDQLIDRAAVLAEQGDCEQAVRQVEVASGLATDARSKNLLGKVRLVVRHRCKDELEEFQQAHQATRRGDRDPITGRLYSTHTVEGRIRGSDVTGEEASLTVMLPKRRGRTKVDIAADEAGLWTPEYRERMLREQEKLMQAHEEQGYDPGIAFEVDDEGDVVASPHRFPHTTAEGRQRAREAKAIDRGRAAKSGRKGGAPELPETRGTALVLIRGGKGIRRTQRLTTKTKRRGSGKNVVVERVPYLRKEETPLSPEEVALLKSHTRVLPAHIEPRRVDVPLAPRAFSPGAGPRRR